jgi:hypothetical protein
MNMRTRSGQAGLVPGHDGNPPEFVTSRDILAKDPLTGRIRRETPQGPTNIAVSRIRWLLEKGKLSERQYAAALRLSTDWEHAQIAPYMCNGLTPGSTGHFQHPNDAKIAAMRRHGDAMDSLGRWRGVVELVVIENRTLAEAAVLLGGIHHQRCAERLETGLDVLADHYGI